MLCLLLTSQDYANQAESNVTAWWKWNSFRFSVEDVKLYQIARHEVLTLVFLIALFNDTVNCWVYTASVVNEWLWSIVEMILTRINWSTQTKTYTSAALSTTNPTRTEVLVNIQAIWDITWYRLKNIRSSTKYQSSVVPWNLRPNVPRHVTATNWKWSKKLLRNVGN